MAGVQLDRKTLADIAVHDPAAFGLFVDAARQAAAA
jgi:ribosomal protein L20